MVRLIDKMWNGLDMLKFLIFLVFLAGFSFCLTEAYSLEVEIGKESQRIIDSMGWIEPEKVSYQEQIQIIIDHSEFKNKVSVGMLSKIQTILDFLII